MAPLDHVPSAADERALAIIPKFPAALSALGSGYIVYDVLCRTRERTAFHYLLLGLSVSDFLASAAWVFSTWASPVGTAMWAAGNVQTCEAQGFFTQL